MAGRRDGADLTATMATLCTDDELGYARSRAKLPPDARLVLDEAYRLAHLPLVAPYHPDVIPFRVGARYDRGQHPKIVSLVMPVPSGALFVSSAFQTLNEDLRAAPFVSKICWSLIERRKERLHATIAGALAVDETGPPALAEAQRRELAALGPITVELRGLFNGNINTGRLYLRVYPERRAGENLFHRVQHILGRPETDLYLVGLYNLTDHLDAAETAILAELIEKWWDRPIVRLELNVLWLLWATDDLVLNGGIAERLPLVG